MTTHQGIRCYIETLTPDNQLHLLEEITAIVRRRIVTELKRSITELEGLGKEIWQEIDAQEYVNQECTS
ncbi:hypothetical protein [Leptolyngbya sp. FACHB-711]|uniref:hypothetical protein n=1 Tax=Leptolyngbya sp. FACHB-711 TaxID=2692813 RepID=UPI0016855F49|nr:hypothetical protein [Cyanobacteria bacterium FACHB-502]MBD2023329.1 hypothetical protein [Leptolyngbya sp. FACHB-711]